MNIRHDTFRLRKPMTSWIILLCFCVAVSACAFGSDSRGIDLRADRVEIEKKILSNVPPGTDMDTVRRYVDKVGFKVRWVSQTHGFYKQNLYEPARTVGEKAIEVVVGKYWTLFLSTEVYADFGFDSSGRLIEVWVSKGTDAP